MAENNPQDNIGCLGSLFSLLFDPLPPKENNKKQEDLKQDTKKEDTKAKKDEKKDTEVQESDVIPESPDYSKSYQAKYLLTKNEWYEYRKLREIADKKDLRVCPKVRLLDLVEPRRGEGYMSLLGKIQSKHVDFVITDKDLHIKAILELDDNSHERADRQERDNFVDEVLTSVGYKVIRTRSVTEDTLNEI